MSKKLKLELDALKVHSFTTDRPAEDRGTVHGRVETSCGAVCTCAGCDDTGDGTVISIRPDAFAGIIVQ
jgi:hypothetical protein